MSDLDRPETWHAPSRLDRKRDQRVRYAVACAMEKADRDGIADPAARAKMRKDAAAAERLSFARDRAAVAVEELCRAEGVIDDEEIARRKNEARAGVTSAS
jgi:hypothetical protein